MLKPIIVFSTIAAICIAPSSLSAKPCYKHKINPESGVSKSQCLKAHKKQKARDKIKYPLNPTMRDLKKRVPDWWNFVKLGRCEQPGRGKYGVNWSHQGPTWGGGLGIYKTSWYIAKSPYKRWSGSMVETILVADAIRDRYSIKSAWGAWRCFYA